MYTKKEDYKILFGFLDGAIAYGNIYFHKFIAKRVNYSYLNGGLRKRGDLGINVDYVITSSKKLYKQISL